MFGKSILIGLGALLSVAYVQADVVLQRGDIVVTVDDIERYIIDNTPERERESILKRKNVFKEMAENIYLIRQLGTEAEKDKALDWEQMEWANALQQKRKAMAALLDKLVIKQIASVDWELLAKETYLAESDQYQIPEKVRVSHVLIKTDSHTDEAAQTLINEIKRKADAGDDFEMLSINYSEDPSVKTNKGDLGLFPRGKMVKSFEDAAFAMSKAGQISEVIKTQFGYHLLQFHQHTAAEKLPFDQVKWPIIHKLQKSRADQIRQDILVAFRSESDLKWDETQLEKLKQKYRVETPAAE